ncbi:MAG: OmpH family outer membrane protein [Bacteroidales bacterium]|nr:OmpH family outer membrane protein [Bacteroidales bacterium]
MKKFLLIVIFMAGMTMAGFSQRYAFVDTDYILNNIPEYTDAQALLNDLSAEWQKEIEAKFQEIDKLYRDYQAESILLPEDIKKQRENEIIQKEKEARDLQRKRFGQDGDLFKKRIELVQPIQEKIFNAIQDMATTRNYAFVFDKASGASILFADSKFDLSDDVLDEVGTVMQTVRRESRTRPTVQASTTGSGQGSTSTTPRTTPAGQGQTTPQQRPAQGAQDSGTQPSPPPPGEKRGR